MKFRMSILFLVAVSLFAGCGGGSGSVFDHFITVDGDRLMEGNREYRFVSFNIPNLHYIEDHMPFDQANPFRLPTEYEIRDALESIRQIGGQVARIYTLPVKTENGDGSTPWYVIRAGEFNEEAFRTLDKVLQVANELGVRLIIPFVDNWKWWGGRADYARAHGKSKDDFWSDPDVIADFKKTIHYVINRKNVYTGVAYRDDKAILCWETGNELQSTPDWVREISAYIKSLDSNHLVMDGFHTTVLRNESIEDPNVDVVTTHHYQKNVNHLIRDIKNNRQRTRGKKPYVVGEFGFIDTEDVRRVLDEVNGDGVSGALIWSLRFHSRDGGFYWHSEPFGGDLFKAYLWPGFETASDYDEINLFGVMREYAYRIQGLETPPVDAPAAPELFDASATALLNWRGSAGAAFYHVERRESEDGPWTRVGENVIDTRVQYRPLFHDATAEIGKSVYYRVIAGNGGGLSGPSNVLGPVTIEKKLLLDELENFSLMTSKMGKLEIVSTEARKTKEDRHRLSARKGASVVYRCDGPVESFMIDGYFPTERSDLTVSVSGDGVTYRSIVPEKTDFYSGGGEYGYWRPVRFSGHVDESAHFIRIGFRRECQIGRIEITYGE